MEDFSKYFEHYYEDASRQQSMLRRERNIRCHISSLLYKGDFTGVEGVIRGVLYADRRLCARMITSQDKWQSDSEPTLLHDILEKPKDGIDPPLSLIQMVLDIAPSVLTIPLVHGPFALQDAVYQLPLFDKKGKSRPISIIRLLVKADAEKQTLTADTLLACAWRKDEEVLRYLLSFEKGRSELLSPINGGRIPLYYASRDCIENGTINSLLQCFIEATAEEMKRRKTKDKLILPKCCCIFSAIEECSIELHDNVRMIEIVEQHKLYCSRHTKQDIDAKIRLEKLEKLRCSF
mmetsp:Transcript_52716/g.61548  ORF Transcript_52716/g.61548 Transcript_52716/m.61548 type:complete len:292 (-) Transcript_52716:248-1123(-)